MSQIRSHPLIVTKGRDSVTELEDILEFPARFDHTVAIETTGKVMK